MHLSIIIPAYNEEKRIGKTLESIADFLTKQSYEAEVLVINNNSKDKTAEVAEGYREQFQHLHVINQPKQGKGFAVTKGMLEAHGDFRLFMDADNSTTVDHFDKMAPWFEKGFDVVIGSIAVRGAKIVRGGGEPLWRVLLGKLGNLWIQVLAVPGIHDTQRGFKVFTAKAVHDIFPRLTIFGWGMDVEILAVARKFKYKIKEVPIVWNNDPDSKVNIWAYPQVLMQTVKVFLNKITGQYGRKIR